ncbi:MAG: flagellar basal body-associated FliL family protein [Caldithrix sp.]|nr:MAG: flagellar basal body-associated FliL family protein [Caldithrix sp.]
MANKDTEKNQESGEKSDDKKGKGGLLKFILIPVILIVQAVGAYFLVFNVLLEHPNKEKNTQKTNHLEVGYFFELNDIVVNPSSTSGKRYLVMEIGLEAKEEKVIAEAESKEIWFRDAINTLLTNKTDAELLNLSKRSLLKKEILKLVNSRMKEGTFSKVYFKKYIMQ